MTSTVARPTSGPGVTGTHPQADMSGPSHGAGIVSVVEGDNASDTHTSGPAVPNVEA